MDGAVKLAGAEQGVGAWIISGLFRKTGFVDVRMSLNARSVPRPCCCVHVQYMPCCSSQASLVDCLVAGKVLIAFVVFLLFTAYCDFLHGVLAAVKPVPCNMLSSSSGGGASPP